MSAMKSLSRYRNIQLDNASPGEILLALYDGMIRSVAEAEAAIVARDLKKRNVAVNRVIAILAELRGALDASLAPELCQNLDRLYRYLSQRVLLASQQLDPAVLTEVNGLLAELRRTWRQAVEQSSVAQP